MVELTLPALITALISAVSIFYPESLHPSQTVNTPQASLKQKFDFIIVGAGSAGCVLANRLSENKKWNVLLIEAGGNDTALTDTPKLHYNLHGTEVDWNYTTVQQSKACLAQNGICSYPRGKVMGGSSSINGMFYVRGNKADYDDWAARGNTGWSYKDVLPYFLKAENNTEPSLASSSFHGTSGPLNVQYPRFVTPMREKYIKAAEEFGWQRGDYNGQRQDVAGYLQMTIDGPSRESTAKAYLKPINARKNLSIIKNSTVTKIIIENGIAKEVEYYRDGKIHTTAASKEIILSAGAIDTPKLLMLSGIGPKDELEKLNIPVLADLPVGRNLQDHLLLPIFVEINETITLTTNRWRTNESTIEYAKYRKGPLTTPGAEAMAFINTNNTSEQPDLQFTWFSDLFAVTWSQNRNIFIIILSNVKPKSVGSVTLKSSNWMDMPLIDPNYFSDQRDFEVFRKGVQYSFEYLRTPTMSKLSPKLYTELIPECSGEIENNFIDCLISKYSGTIFHPVGTAKMGPECDKDAVVNPNLQVYGIKNLRVIDASIMPIIPGGNTNAPTIMIAEKGSDIIKAFYSRNIF